MMNTILARATLERATIMNRTDRIAVWVGVIADDERGIVSTLEKELVQ